MEENKLKGKILKSIPKIPVGKNTVWGNTVQVELNGKKSKVINIPDSVITCEIYPLNIIEHKKARFEDYFVKIIRRTNE